MKYSRMIIPAALVALACLAAGFAGPVFAQVDFGDYTSATLTAKAWDAQNRGANDEALAYIAKCLELFETQAKNMQSSLSDFPPNVPTEATAKYWALNDVGTCLFIKGDILLKQGNKAVAKEVFTRLRDEFGYAQCWDPKGWYWKPAQAAKQKLVEIDFEQP